ncbi:histidine kinase dimerization/phosphoacceptor domain -containing protein [Mucilaginibacter sp. L3T2-6]|uniref:tetratricopeptide repeat-containing sensor histidine kinase n=1 Tax=Mucilaginibacter sp. L3T2-6 TaxID=3062491 RepID=UPI00267680FE|nr:histidine kinase dimerization/phosphoacceptor domain -containing protein [Mucilaginibacter sp. L3T2-6]MDO3644375.1 histidine kinase dimerization/phosphoacceptor domain -containing protein [Mucilaginibacter sp. L3T2-6]MDV6216827.1 histidine kinase dimerization/phosphoacceptor domain -containing protein [Mucilaginibacter sp. L3T2-6]
MKISKAKFLLFFVIAPVHLCFCQVIPRKSVDSLQEILKTLPADTFKLNALHQLGNYYHQRRFKQDPADLDSALFFFKKELALSNLLRVETGSGRQESLCSMGEVYLSKTQMEQSKACFIQVWNYYKKTGDKRMEGKAWLRFAKAANEAAWLDRPAGLFEQIVQACGNSIVLFKATGHIGDEINAHMNLAATYFIYGKYDQAEAACMKPIVKYPGNSSSEFIRLYYVLAHVQRYKGNLNKALSCTLKSMDLLQKSPNYPDKITVESQLFGELALIYDAMGQTENSIVWYKRTLALRENMNIKLEYKYRTAGFIVQGLIKQKKYGEAFSTAWGVEQRHPPDGDYNRAIISQIKAYCYDAAGNYKKAEEMYLLALKLFRYIKTDEIVSLAKYDVAKFYIKRSDYKKAAFYLDEGIRDGFATTRQRDYHLIRYKIDSASGNYPSALRHHILYKLFNDSIFNIEKNKQLQELQVRFETQQKERDIQSLKKDSLRQREKTGQANNIRNLTLAGSALLVVLLALIYTNYRAKQRANTALNALVSEKDELLKEKEWLIKEVHHRVKNNLQIVMGLLQRQSAYIDNEAALQAIQNSESRMHSIALIHQKLYQSENLDLINMPEYVNELVNYLRESADTGTRIKFEKTIDDIFLTVSQAVPLGLIMNEAITNALKYAYNADECGVIRITLERTDHQNIALAVEDDGRGLQPDFDLNKLNSLGMSLMRGLSKQINGVFEITRKKGVQVLVTFKMEYVARTPHELTNR